MHGSILVQEKTDKTKAYWDGTKLGPLLNLGYLLIQATVSELSLLILTLHNTHSKGMQQQSDENN